MLGGTISENHSSSPGAPTIAALDALSFDGPPQNGQQLDHRVAAIAQALDVAAARARVLISSVIVAQMLPGDTVVKGGIGVKLRLGESGTRATRDVDVVTLDRERFFDDLTARLAAGWGTVPPLPGVLRKDPAAPPRVAFTGVVKPEKPARPPGVPTDYVMAPYKVTLQFLARAWAKVPVEVAHDEIGGLEHAETSAPLPGQLEAIAAALGCGPWEPVPLISLEQQIAQKIHAAVHPLSDRAHDLVDLQLLWHAGTVDGQSLDMALLASQCERTFAYRRVLAWPPAVVRMPGDLEPAYQVARDEAAPVLSGRHTDSGDAATAPELGAAPPRVEQTLSGAIGWLTARIAQIAAAAP